MEFILVWGILVPVVLLGVTVVLFFVGYIWYKLFLEWFYFFNKDLKTIFFNLLKTLGCIWITLIAATLIAGWIIQSYPLIVDFFK